LQHPCLGKIKEEASVAFCFRVWMQIFPSFFSILMRFVPPLCSVPCRGSGGE
jgi:hypothetical protein